MFTLVFVMACGGFVLRCSYPWLTETQLFFSCWWYWLLLVVLVLTAFRLARNEVNDDVCRF